MIGVDIPYEPPANPDVTIGSDDDPRAAAGKIVDFLLRRGILCPGN